MGAVMNEYFEFLTSEKGMKFLAFIGGGLVVLAVGAFQLIKFLKKKDVTASNHSVASGRDTNININSDENSNRKK